MSCLQYENTSVLYMEGLLPHDQATEYERHLKVCETCATELEKFTEIQNKLSESGRKAREVDLVPEMLDRIILEQSRDLKHSIKFGSIINKLTTIFERRSIRLSAATVMIAVIIFTVGIIFNSLSPATAETILYRAVKATENISTIYMKAWMRTLPDENFGLIGLDYDFIPVEMWKQIDSSGKLKWRVEKSGRFVVMDGESTALFTKTNQGLVSMSVKDEAGPLGCCFDTWMGRLLDVNGLLNTELKGMEKDAAIVNGSVKIRTIKVNGRKKKIVEMMSDTMVPEDDYFRNKYIDTSSLLKIYVFDSDTNLLEDFKIYALNKSKKVLIFEVTDIEYNTPIRDSIFYNMPVPNTRQGPDIMKLNDLSLFDDASPDEVKKYIRSIIDISEEQNIFLYQDPQVAMLTKVGKQNLPLLIDALSYSNPLTDIYIVGAIMNLADESSKSYILDSLPVHPNLVKVVIQNGWETDARDILLAELKGPGRHLPDEWIKAVANLRDRESYPLLREYFINGPTRSITYRAIQHLPIENMPEAVAEAWRRSKYDFDGNRMAFIALRYGDLDALEALIESLTSRPFDNDRTIQKIRYEVMEYIDFRGSDEELKSWFQANRSFLRFDPEEKKFVVDKKAEQEAEHAQ